MMGVVHAAYREDLNVFNATLTACDLTSFCRLDELGLEATAQAVTVSGEVLECQIAEQDQWCRHCGGQGQVRETITRPLAHEPFGWRPTLLRVRVRRYRCRECGHVWRQDMSWAAEPRARLSRTRHRVGATGPGV